MTEQEGFFTREVRTVKEIEDEIERIKEIPKDNPQMSETSLAFRKGKVSGLCFALGKKVNFDGEVME